MSFGLGHPPAASGFGGATSAEAAVVETGIDASTPWVAAADGNLPLLQQSLQHLQLTVTAADEEQNYTLLQAAASYNQMAVLEWIWSSQQAVTASGEPNFRNAVDKDGDSALHYASTAQAAQFLVERAGIDVQIRNQAGLTALEAKQMELNEMMQDEEDFDEDDIEFINLKGTVEYLQSLLTATTWQQ